MSRSSRATMASLLLLVVWAGPAAGFTANAAWLPRARIAVAVPDGVAPRQLREGNKVRRATLLIAAVCGLIYVFPIKLLAASAAAATTAAPLLLTFVATSGAADVRVFEHVG